MTDRLAEAARKLLAIMKHMEPHAVSCELGVYPHQNCTCGMDATRRELDEALAEYDDRDVDAIHKTGAALTALIGPRKNHE